MLLFFVLGLFLPAGTWMWTKGWLFILVIVVASIVITLYLRRANPDVIAARVNRHEGTKGWDRLLLGILIPAMVSILPVAALDDGRYHWFHVPWWVCVLGYALLIAGMAGMTWAESVNKFFEPTVRIQTDRGHKVIDAGPYAIVRHPGYAFGYLLSVGMPLALGSLWALIPVILSGLLMVLRTVWEDQTLREELAGLRGVHTASPIYYPGKKDHHKRVTTERPTLRAGVAPREGHGKGKLIRILFSVYFGGFRGYISSLGSRDRLLLDRIGCKDLCGSWFRGNIRLDSGFALAYNNRGNAWRVRKNYDMAIADYKEAIRLDRTFAPAYHALAWLWATCPEESFRHGKRAVELATRACGLAEWKDANMLATLAAAYAEVGEFDKAVEWEEKAIQLYANADDRKKGEERLKLYKDKKPYRETE